MTKKKKIILISLAVTLALAVGVGGLVYAQVIYEHEDVGGNKLLGVGEMGYYIYGYWDQYQAWDTQFIITNPNCDQDLTIEWVAVIAGEDVGMFSAEEVLGEGTPADWNEWFGEEIVPYELSPHEVWQIRLSELIACACYGLEPDYWVHEHPLGKYTVEVTWSGAYYTGWWWWGYWRSGRPLTGWQKEKCWSEFNWGEYFPAFSISEAPMELFHSRTPFEPGEPYFRGD